VVVEGPVVPADLQEGFPPLFERNGDDVLKIQSVYVETTGTEVLLDTLVVESGHPQHFFIQVRRRNEGVVVRLLPQTDPEKTPGVKRAVARVAVLIRDLHPASSKFGSTNLEEYLPPLPEGP